ncbi:MAG: YggT family protein [Clostridia bacterium]|jgi:YggT family protein|nr:YggT family protein [Clostridia bacterium]MDH7573285.1 YggT family protein [Clostridia bacterium]
MNLVLDSVHIAFRLLELLILIRVLLSWFRPSLANPAVRFVYDFTELILAPVRRLMPATGMVDFSPLVALLLLYVVENWVVMPALYRLLF